MAAPAQTRFYMTSNASPMRSSPLTCCSSLRAGPDAGKSATVRPGLSSEFCIEIALKKGTTAHTNDLQSS